MGRGNSITRRRRRKLHAPAGEESIGGDQQRIGLAAQHGDERYLDLATGTGVEELDLQPDCARSLRQVPLRGLITGGIARVDQRGNASGLGHQIVQQPEPLGRDISGEKIDASRIAARPSKTGDQTQFDWVGTDAEYDRDGCGRGFRRERGRITGGSGDNGDTAAGQIRHERRQHLIAAVQPVVLDRQIA